MSLRARLQQAPLPTRLLMTQPDIPAAWAHIKKAKLTYEQAKARPGYRDSHLGMAERLLFPPAPKPATRQEPLVWRQAGVWVTTPGNFNPDRRAHATAFGFKWFAEGLGANLPVGWVVGTDDPEKDAQWAFMLLNSGGKAIISNDEDIYERQYRGRSQVFLDKLRGKYPDVPLLLAGNGYGGEGGVRDMDYPAWIKAGASFAPEAYANVHPELTVRNCVEHALRAGWPRERIHPMLGTYQSDAEHARVTSEIVAQYISDLHDYRILGFSIYVGDQTPDWVIEQLGRGIADLGLAA